MITASSPIKNIESLITALPEKDVPLGYKFLKERNFLSLRELIVSALYKVRKNLRSSNPKEEYLKVNPDNLEMLRSEVDMYMYNIIPPGDEIYCDLCDFGAEEELY